MLMSIVTCSCQLYILFTLMKWTLISLLNEVSKGAKIRNQYSQVPHLSQDTNGKVINSQLGTINESQEVSPFPAGDHEAHINRRTQRHSKRRTEKNIKYPQKNYCLGTANPLKCLRKGWAWVLPLFALYFWFCQCFVFFFTLLLHKIANSTFTCFTKKQENKCFFFFTLTVWYKQKTSTFGMRVLCILSHEMKICMFYHDLQFNNWINWLYYSLYLRICIWHIPYPYCLALVPCYQIGRSSDCLLKEKENRYVKYIIYVIRHNRCQ